MEIEAKYELSGADEAETIFALPLIRDCRAGDAKEILMDSTYYKDADGRLEAMGYALRLRFENGKGVCCLKRRAGQTTGAVKTRYELELPAAEIGEGAAALIAAGAPRDFREVMATARLLPAARIRFTRRALPLSRDGMTAELAFDRGELGSAGQEIFYELELEWKSGPREAFFDLLRELETAYPLTPQPLSKLARALAAEAGHENIRME